MQKRGFTLAEVLITLAIIGIVAAVTIPSVIANYQQSEFKTGLRKAVSVLNEAIQAHMAQDGESPYDNENLFLYLQQHMSVLKTISTVKNYAFYTTDGMRFEFVNEHVHDSGNMKLHETNTRAGGARWNPSGSGFGHTWQSWCGSKGLANNPNETKNTPCVILVDVNGDRKPTTYGANATKIDDDGTMKQNYVYPHPTDKRVTDIFNILITEDRAIPFGVVAQRAMYNK